MTLKGSNVPADDLPDDLPADMPAGDLPDGGLRADPSSSLLPPGQSLTAACRAFLRAGMPEGDAHQAHVSLCAFCSARLVAMRRLAAVLGAPVPPPAELRSMAFLDQIRVRIIEQSERSAVGSLLDKEMPVVVPAAVDDAFPHQLLDSDLARRTVPHRTVPHQAVPHQAGLAESLSAPEPAASAAWARIRSNVLREAAGPVRWIDGAKVGLGRTGPLRRHRVVVLAGAVAAAMICVMLVADGTSTAPTIVITDVSAMPSVEFSPMSVIRHGSNH